MVDTISNAKGIRHGASATKRFGAPSVSSPTGAAARPVAPVSAVSDSEHRDPDQQPAQDERYSGRDTEPQGADLRLEISEDSNGAELLYRFVDAKSGAVVREWPAGEFGKLRDYMRDKKIHLLDKKI